MSFVIYDKNKIKIGKKNLPPGSEICVDNIGEVYKACSRITTQKYITYLGLGTKWGKIYPTIWETGQQEEAWSYTVMYGRRTIVLRAREWQWMMKRFCCGRMCDFTSMYCTFN